MPDLKQSLLSHDFGHLLIIAEHWGVELGVSESKTALPILVENLLGVDLLVETIETLPTEAKKAIDTMQAKKGRLPWSQFTRRFGEVREMGPGRRDRERPDRTPASPAEVLWYRGLVGRAFFDTARGTEEFAYIPDDLLALLSSDSGEPNRSQTEIPSLPLGRPATASERTHLIPATDRILDHACTLLAALRVGITPPSFEPFDPDFIHALLQIVELLAPDHLPEPEATRTFLESPRGSALLQLVEAWINSPEVNDLHHIPGLLPEGEWTNDPLTTRHFILQLLLGIPGDTWWSLSSFQADVRQRHPDFQRPAGDYDSWFLRDEASGDFLRGFEHWDDVDGALIRYLISGPLHWLGILDLAASEETAPVTAFRFSGWAARLLAGAPPQGLPEELSKIHVRSDGRVSVPALAPRAIRYQLARFCQWEDETPHEYRYRLIPSSLKRARKQGLRVGHLLSILRRHADAIPPNIVTALNHWNERGSDAQIQQTLVLKVGSPEILQILRSSRAARFLGEPLGPAAVIVKPGAGEKVLAALVELGYLGELIGES
jgi:hypothetical protein